MRIVFVGFARGDGRIGLLSNESDGWIVDASFAFVVVLLDWSFRCGALWGFRFRGVFGAGLVSVFGSGHENPSQ